MKAVYIEWLDANSARGPLWGKAAREYTCQIVKTCGLLMGEDEEVVRLCQDYWTHDDQDWTQPEAYRDIEVIPKALIKRRAEWEIKDTGSETTIETGWLDGGPAKLSKIGMTLVAEGRKPNSTQIITYTPFEV